MKCLIRKAFNILFRGEGDLIINNLNTFLTLSSRKSFRDPLASALHAHDWDLPLLGIFNLIFERSLQLSSQTCEENLSFIYRLNNIDSPVDFSIKTTFVKTKGKQNLTNIEKSSKISPQNFSSPPKFVDLASWSGLIWSRTLEFSSTD